MSLAVVGLGLASPAGLRSSENVFFLRAGEPPRRASPFVDAEGESAPVAVCPTLGARLSFERRCVALAELALDECLASVDRKHLATASVIVSAPPPSTSGVERRVLARTGGREALRAPGAAGVFAELAAFEARAGVGQGGLALFVAVDSWIDLALLGERVAHPPNPWMNEVTLPAEGAAALLVATTDVARALGLGTLATLRGASAAMGPAHDDNDEIVDGAALTSVLRALPSASPIGAVFGQQEVDRLRRRDWEIAVARCSTRFVDQHESVCLESELGLVGAASGAMSLAFGITQARHRAASMPAALGAPLVAWAIDRAGLRGAALATVGDA